MDFPLDWIEPDILAASSIPTDMQSIHALHQQGIRAIVSLTERPILGRGDGTMNSAESLGIVIADRSDITTQGLEALGIVYLHDPIPDGLAPDLDQAGRIVDFIDKMAEQQRPVFIHCFAGIGRTGTMLHAYYLAHGYSLEPAKVMVKARRPGCAFVNLSHPQQMFLQDFAAVRHPAKPVQ